jgi:hypothetical protein
VIDPDVACTAAVPVANPVSTPAAFNDAAVVGCRTQIIGHVEEVVPSEYVHRALNDTVEPFVTTDTAGVAVIGVAVMYADICVEAPVDNADGILV